MSAQRRSPHGEWSSGPIFVLAVTGSAVGLSNVWKFPAMEGANGGGAFFLVYLVCLLILGFPLLVAEIMLGRRGRHAPVRSLAVVAAEEGRSSLWQSVGWLSLLAALGLLGTYSVVASWSMAYVFRAASGIFSDLDSVQAAETFQTFIADPEKLLAWHTMFMAVMVMLSSRGVRWGLEEAIRWFMPTLLGLLILLAGYTAAATGYLDQALAYLLMPDFSKLSWHAVLLALSHAFFSLSLGLGAVMVYGAYLGHDVPIIRSAVWILAIDTLVAILAGVVVFSVIFSSDLPTGSGPTLTFQILPLAFGQMPNGTWFGTLFFLLLMFAAWSSAIALMEPMVATLVERGTERALAASYVGLAAWVVGVAALLSLNVWDYVHPLRAIESFRGSNMFDLIAFAAANVLLPVVGLALSIFAGWRVSAATARLELGEGRGYALWRFLIRYVTPIAMGVVIISAWGYGPGV